LPPINADNMSYTFVISIFLIIVLITAFFKYRKWKRRKKFMASLRASWGVPKQEFNSEDLVQQYFIYKNKDTSQKTLNDQICDDLDFSELFKYLDRTTSVVGQQYLFAHLRNRDIKKEELLDFDNAVEYFSANKPDREKTQEIISSLQNFDAFYLTELMFGMMAQKPKWYPVIPLLFSMTILSIILIPFYHAIGLLTIFLIPVNCVFHYLNKNNIKPYMLSFPQLLKLLEACILLKNLNLPIKIKHQTDKEISSIKSIKRSLFFVSLDEYLESDEGILGWFVIELLKSFFLIEVMGFYTALKSIENKRNDIHQLFSYIGYYDTILSTASLRNGLPYYCKPVFSEDKKQIKFKEIYHPLIADCVTNDLEINGKSILLTGSNMSGKTTFVRTVAINNILAQTLNTCFAKEFQIPVLNTYSAIRISDNLMESKSYYFEEVLTIKELINKVENNEESLFMIDELFKGTNTIERVAAAKAVLSYLNKNNNIVFASTHDIELADLLKDEYDLYHFTETIEKEQLIFDYKLKTGKLTTRNAIRILELNGYPAEIIMEARKLS